VHPRALLHQRGFHPKKRYGQHFLMDYGAARRIARLALEDAQAPRRVVEIGAGTGALTLALLEEGGDVTALEIDADLMEILRERDDLTRAHLVLADALVFEYGDYAAHGPWRVAGNLPYNIATPLLMRLVEMENGPGTITVMVQKDVADRLVAVPGTPAYGSLSVAVQYQMHARRSFTLGPRFFYPPPKVDSTVIHMARRDRPAVEPRDPELFRKVVRAAFAYRRKTLVNSLALALNVDRDRISNAVSLARIPSETRGERLDLNDFARLADALAGG
jgi:16S rRNA (adenine1518-N6/adenine1519-N6)-dimethyltransferase